jgi:hypothetical protein
MGWNDRLPEDPFIPVESYYEEHDRYEAWLEYQNICAAETERQLTSQNIDPAMLAGKPLQETPQRRHTLSRLWEKFFGQEIASKAGRESDNADFPF